MEVAVYRHIYPECHEKRWRAAPLRVPGRLPFRDPVLLGIWEDAQHTELFQNSVAWQAG